MKPTKQSEFSNRLKDLRHRRGIGQKELAAYLHVSTGTVSNYENGVHSPDLDTLCLIADFYKVSADYLLGRTMLPPDLRKQYRHILERQLCFLKFLMTQENEECLLNAVHQFKNGLSAGINDSMS